jgi:hypothetical protein
MAWQAAPFRPPPWQQTCPAVQLAEPVQGGTRHCPAPEHSIPLPHSLLVLQSCVAPVGQVASHS